MVQVEIPLWIIHSTSTPIPSNISTNSKVLTPAESSTHKKNKNFNLLKLLSGTSSRSPIYTVDICPLNHILATGGGDGSIRLWDFHLVQSNASVLGEKKGISGNYDNNGYESNHSMSSSSDRNSTSSLSSSDVYHEPFNVLKSHTGSILSIRFSSSGKYLASGGDDHLVLLYTCLQTKEWIRTHTCRGHNLDVMGVCWSPDESYVVSCSLDKDSPIVLWKTSFKKDVSNTMDPFDFSSSANNPTTNSSLIHPHKTLGIGVQNSVKGVCFDPIGTFIIAHGSKGQICFYRCSDDFTLERTIEKQESTNSPMLKRIDCSPDGEWICITNLMVKGRHVAGMLSLRNKEEKEEDGANLVGHRNAIVCSRYCRYFIEKQSSHNDDQFNYGMMVAVGDQRGFLTVWSTEQSRPIFKCQVSENRCAITDLAWGLLKESSLFLVVSLLDGHVVVVSFETSAEEVGVLVKSDVRKQILDQKYGIKDGMVRVGSDGPQLKETAFQYMDTNTNNSMPSNTTISTVHQQSLFMTPQPPQTQTVTTLSGKKRIRPMLINYQQQEIPPQQTPLQSPPPSQPQLNPTQAAMQNLSSSANAVDEMSQHQHPSSTTLPPLQQYSLNMISSPSSLTTDLPFEQGDECPIIASVQNKTVTSQSCFILTITQSGTTYYTDTIPFCAATNITASSLYLAIASKQGCCFVYKTYPTWKSLQCYKSHPTLLYTSSILHLALSNESHNLLVITTDGNFMVNDLEKNQLLYKGSILSAQHYILSSTNSKNASIKVLRAFFHDNQLILVLYQSKSMIFQAFWYDIKMEIWSIIYDSRMNVHTMISTTSTNGASSANLLAKLVSQFSVQNTSSFVANAEQRNTFSKSYLQNSIAVALALGSQEDYLHFLKLYIQKLAILGEEDRIRFIVNVFLNRSDEKKKFLEVMTNEIAKNVNLGRLVSEFRNEMDLLYS